MTTVLDLVRDACNDDDRLHFVVPTGRRGSEVILLVGREQHEDVPLFHLRYLIVDLADGTAGWGDQGMRMRLKDELPAALAKAFGRTSSATVGSVDLDDVGPAIVGGGVDVDPEALLSDPLDVEEDDSDDEDDEDDEQPDLVECLTCGQNVRRTNAVSVTFGGETLYRHRGECP